MWIVTQRKGSHRDNIRDIFVLLKCRTCHWYQKTKKDFINKLRVKKNHSLYINFWLAFTKNSQKQNQPLSLRHFVYAALSRKGRAAGDGISWCHMSHLQIPEGTSQLGIPTGSTSPVAISNQLTVQIWQVPGTGVGLDA